MVKYDPEVIVEMAETLNREAIEVQVVQTLLFLCVGLAVGLVGSFILSLLPVTSVWREWFPPGSLLLGSSLVFSGIGFLRALEEARDLRFRSHLALCQVEIERHLSKIARRPR
jgi:hypothetical protein